MISRERCSTSYDLASLLRGRPNTLDGWSAKSQNALVRGRHSSALKLPFLKEVSQTCFNFAVVNFEI